ncbi:hypothetical protein G6F47_009175 [Rhizopus delemar]|nr:hypothetical protein G6F47_009175 [Rhizopus delemar]
MFTRSHAIQCLHMHQRLQMPSTEPDPLSFLLSKLPTKRKNGALKHPPINSFSLDCPLAYYLSNSIRTRLPPSWQAPFGNSLSWNQVGEPARQNLT